ncbi:hypothetical protein M0Q03_03580 [bacterium]|jgi:hypothetical protein|nr:hypothetical protein [bacterium]
MDITCQQNIETGQTICNIPFPEDNGIAYNNIIQPEQATIVIIIVVWFFTWILERIFFYITHRTQKTYYDN